MPLNLRTHGHAQGYADSNFLIPELLSYVLAHKGPYDAQDGAFSSPARFTCSTKTRSTKGSFRSPAAASATPGLLPSPRRTEISLAVPPMARRSAILQRSLGAWRQYARINSVLRWSRGTQEDGASVTFMGTPISGMRPIKFRFAPSTPGCCRYGARRTLAMAAQPRAFRSRRAGVRTEGNQATRVEGYVVRSTLDLYSNYTYFLAHQNLGDQIRQFDYRTIVGVNAQHAIRWADVNGAPVETRIGFQGRYDDIRLGLQESVRRQLYDTLSNNAVGEGSIGLWTDTAVRWTPWLKTVAARASTITAPPSARARRCWMRRKS